MIHNWLEKNLQHVIDIRRWLHKHPEVGFNEHETSRYCQKLMIDMGYTINQNDKMQTGFFL